MKLTLIVILPILTTITTLKLSIITAAKAVLYQTGTIRPYFKNKVTNLI